MENFALGVRPPQDSKHVEKFGFASAARGLSPNQVNSILSKGVRSELPAWHPTHRQSWTNSCVGHAAVMERAITNLAQRRKQKRKPYTVRFDPIHVWRQAKDRDEWPESSSDPNDNYGTSTRAAYDVLRTEGAVPIKGMRDGPYGPEPWGTRRLSKAAGVAGVNRWCSNVDEARLAFAEGYKAVAISVPWYAGFEPWNLEWRNDASGRGRYWLRSNPRTWQGGNYRGFHAMCLFGADDRIDAFWLKNSWAEYAENSVALIPYAAVEDCFAFWAEIAVVTDR